MLCLANPGRSLIGRIDYISFTKKDLANTDRSLLPTVVSDISITSVIPTVMSDSQYNISTQDAIMEYRIFTRLTVIVKLSKDLKVSTTGKVDTIFLPTSHLIHDDKSLTLRNKTRHIIITMMLTIFLIRLFLSFMISLNKYL